MGKIKNIDTEKDKALFEKLELQIRELEKTMTELRDKGYGVSIGEIGFPRELWADVSYGVFGTFK